MKALARIFILFLLVGLVIGVRAEAANVTPPSTTDAGRVDNVRRQVIPLNPSKYAASEPKAVSIGMKIPDKAKSIKFVLNNVALDGVTVFKPEELRVLYQKYLNQEITLDIVWEISAAITKYYQDKGYFLSQATIPQQEIGQDGRVKIKVVEGYIGAIDLDEEYSKKFVINSFIDKLRAAKPINIKVLESVLLQLNDLAGLSFQSVIEPLSQESGAVKLVLVAKRQASTAQVTFDNYSSMYLGPYEASVAYQANLLPLHKTSVTYLASTPVRELKYFSVSHDIAILPGVYLGFYGGRTVADPGYSLKNFDILSTSNNFGFSLTQQFIRQRQKNLSVKLKIEGRNVASDILFTTLTRDRVREAILSVAYDSSDRLEGYNYLNIAFTQGISAFNASKKGDEHLSRNNVVPDYRKLELSATRFQGIGKSLMSVTSIASQFSSGFLYSSSQFGYGGQAFGRAFDSSEITGDKGVSASIEMRYTALPGWNNMNLVPFVFYDIGKVWGDNEISKTRNSIGEGFRIDSPGGFAATFTIANPLMHGVATPRYDNRKSPRYLAQLSYKF